MIGSLWRQSEDFGSRVLVWFGCSAVTARQLIRFGVVGICAASVYVCAMALVVDAIGWSIVTGAVIAFVAGTAVSYAGNALWNFQTRLTPGNAVRFLAVTAAGMLVNVAIAWLGESLGAGYLLVSLMVMVVVPLFNFVGHRLVTFRAAHTPPGHG
jgi:putative flippase GtrA